MAFRSTPDLYSSYLDQLVAADIGRTRLDAPLAEHNSWQIGGPADLLVEPETIDSGGARGLFCPLS